MPDNSNVTFTSHRDMRDQLKFAERSPAYKTLREISVIVTKEDVVPLRETLEQWPMAL